MPRVAIPIVVLDRLGKVPPSQVQGDDVNLAKFSNNHGETLIEIVNKDGSNLGRVGFEFFEQTVDGSIVKDKITNAIPAGGTILVGPFPSQYYSRDNLDVNVNPVAGSAHSLWFRGYELVGVG